MPDRQRSALAMRAPFQPGELWAYLFQEHSGSRRCLPDILLLTQRSLKRLGSSDLPIFFPTVPPSLPGLPLFPLSFSLIVCSSLPRDPGYHHRHPRSTHQKTLGTIFESYLSTRRWQFKQISFCLLTQHFLLSSSLLGLLTYIFLSPDHLFISFLRKCSWHVQICHSPFLVFLISISPLTLSRLGAQLGR